jgi:GGDEF domain-containing protein
LPLLARHPLRHRTAWSPSSNARPASAEPGQPDSLTGLPNRKLHERLEAAIQQARADESGLIIFLTWTTSNC